MCGIGGFVDFDRDARRGGPDASLYGMPFCCCGVC